MTIDQFGKALVASGLMTADDVKATWNTLPPESRPKDGAAFGKLLVEKSLLTPFQVAELLAGRGARLIMGDYTIVAQIGAGGMGQVYKAQHRRMKRTVALKVMSNAAMQDEAAVKRFQREVHAAARLEHPNIVTAYDSGESGSVKYLVMQFVDGGDLSDLVKKTGRLPIEQAVGYVIQAARGLAFAHGEGVIHRDIKPANLLLDKKGVVKILDMGLARFEDGGDGLTATEQVMGTVDYMSPEQAANTKGCDGRADIYSLGCTLWFLLTGKKLYEADTLIARLMLHRDGPLPSLVKERDDAPWPLEQALHKMIAKRAADRYQSMDEVVAALAPYGGDPSLSGSVGGSGAGGGQSAELASFMQAMGSGGTKTSHPSATQMKSPAAKPATSANLEATAQLSTADVGTDPKSQVLPKDAPAAKAQSQSKKKRPGNDKTKLIAAGALGGLLLLAGIIVLIRNKDGDVVAEINVPAGASVEVVTQPQAGVKPNAQSVPVAAVALPIAQMLDSPDYGWGAPENLGPNVNSSHDDWKPTLTADELRMVFRGDGGTSQQSSLWECRRKSIDEPFGPRARLTGSAYEDEPFLSADGLTLLYDSHAIPSGRMAEDIRVRRRVSLDAPWSKPETLSLAEDRDEQTPWLSPDGLTLIYAVSSGVNGSRDLWICSRTTPDASFGPSTPYSRGVNGPASESCPQLLSDGRTLLFSRDGKPHLTFIARNGVQSALQLYGVADDVRDVWLSNDGRRLYFNSKRAGGLGGYDIWMMRLMPKNGATPSVPSSVASVPPSFVNPTNPSTPPPAGDYALRLIGENTVVAPNPQLDESQPFTVEAYITPGDINPNVLIGRRLFGVDSEFHIEIKDSRWRFYSTHNEAMPPERFVPRRRVHVAGVRTTTGRQLYLDGKLVASKDDPLKLASKESNSPLLLEARGPAEFTFDELRISQGIVYDKEFAPPAKLTADANTLALYHFDEGFGDVLKDSSGKGRDGKITGATWVKADGSPISATSAIATTIPAEALTFAGHRYLLVDSAPGKKLKWNEAKARSEAMGGHLATVNSQAELEWMQKTFRNVPAANGLDRDTYRLWLGGINDIQNPDRWTWVTGEPFDRALWQGAGPGDAKAGISQGLSWYGLGWDDAPEGTFARFFLVEWDTLATAAPQAGPTSADYALQFDGKSAHVVTPLVHQPNQPLTIEVTLLPGPIRGAIISDSEGRGIGLDVVDDVPNFLVSRRSGGQESYARISATRKLENDRPHRLAAVFDGANIRLFVDGQLQSVSDLAGEYLPSGLPFIIGASPEDVGIDYPFAGTLDEVRFSKSARYSSNYTPPSRLETDAETIALYHFDEGSGNVLRDSSGHGRDAAIAGATWVGMNRPPIDYAHERRVAQWFIDRGVRITVIVGGKKLRPDTSLTPEKLTLFAVSPENAAVSEAEIRSLKTELPRLADFTSCYIGRIHSDVWAEVFADVPQIYDVNAYNSQITAIGLAHLARLPKLGYLNLDKCTAIDSAALAALSNCRSLTKLSLDRARFEAGDFSLADVQTLQDALPACHIYFVGNSEIPGLKRPPIGSPSTPATSAPPPPTSPSTAPTIPSAGSAAAIAGLSRWPLAPTKPEEIDWLKSLGIRLILRNGTTGDRAVPFNVPAPTGSWTVVGIELNRDRAQDIDDKVLERIAKLVDLEAFLCDLPKEGTRCTQAGLDQLKQLKNLRHLSLGRLVLPQADPKFLEAFPDLESLTLRNGQFVGWEPYAARMEKLSLLSLYMMDDADLKRLGVRPQLVNLRFAGYQNFHPKRLAAVQPFAAANPWCRVTFVGLDGDNMKELVVEPTAPPPASTAASTVEDPATVAAWLLENKKLAKIRFEIDGRTQMLSTVPTSPFKVVELNFSPNNNAGKPLSEAEIARLAVFTDLEFLEIGSQPLTDAGLAGLAGLKKLKTLVINNTPLTPAAVTTIRQFPQLETLHASSTDEWLRPLAGMPSIKAMIIYKTPISTEAMSWFPQYPNLSELRLHDSFEAPGVRLSVALAPLKDCKNLKKLFLNTSKFDADALAVMSGLNGLIELDLFHSNISEAQLKQLTAALPRCQIKWRDAANNFKQYIFEPSAPPKP